MEGLLLEFGEDRARESIVELAEELVEDPRCRLVLMGADQNGVVLVTIWDAEVIGEVEAGLAADGTRLRRLTLVNPTSPGLPS